MNLKLLVILHDTVGVESNLLFFMKVEMREMGGGVRKEPQTGIGVTTQTYERLQPETG
jgi:hypothetical protein